MKRVALLFFLVIGLVLAACSPATPSPTIQPAVEPTALPPTQPTATPTQNPGAQPAQPASSLVLQLAELTDTQGEVAMIVKPLDLNSSQDALNFEVTMDTHSIDLSMDLAALATLTTDTGMSVQAARWEAPLGGHHVSGTLSFPSIVEGKTLLDGVSKLTLIIKDVDASERVFTWDIK